MRALTCLVCLALTWVAAFSQVPPLAISSCDATSVVKQVCAEQPVGSYCNPCDTKKFVACDGEGAGSVKSCKPGTSYDYLLRSCIKGAVTCPDWPCPTKWDPASIPSQKYLGAPGPVGNATIDLDEEGSFWVACPVNGHCTAGMVFKVTVRCPASVTGYTGTVHVVDFYEPVENEVAYPLRLKDVTATCGDKLFIAWEEGFHMVATVKEPRKTPGGIVPYVPQPVYKCPPVTWNDSDPTAYPPGTQMVAPITPFGNVSVDGFTKEGSFFALCQLANHCRMGMVFKVTVQSGGPAYEPQVVPIWWVMTGRNFPDITIHYNPATNKSDTLSFRWFSPNGFDDVSTIEFHGVMFADELEAYFSN